VIEVSVVVVVFGKCRLKQKSNHQLGVAVKSLSLLSFDLLFVAFDSSSFCCDSGADVVVVVVEVDVVALELDIVCGV
tara:strand:- start:628 stop:858 length:231 start_codon:yes stop_codon:yes gene_type:complete